MCVVFGEIKVNVNVFVFVDVIDQVCFLVEEFFCVELFLILFGLSFYFGYVVSCVRYEVLLEE